MRIAPGDRRDDQDRLNPDRPPATAADRARQLAAEYWPLAVALGQEAETIHQHPDGPAEWISAACVGLCEAANRFEPATHEPPHAQPVKFATYARHRIRGAIADERRRILAARLQIIPETDTVEGTATDRRTPDPAADVAGRDFVQSLLKALPRKGAHRPLIVALYLRGLTQNEAAAAVGISQSRANAAHREALEMLRETLTRRREARPCSY